MLCYIISFVCNYDFEVVAMVAGDEGLSKSKNSDAEVEQVTKGEGETRLQE